MTSKHEAIKQLYSQCSRWISPEVLQLYLNALKEAD